MLAESSHEIQLSCCGLSLVYASLFLYTVNNVSKNSTTIRTIVVLGLALCAYQIQHLSFKLVSSPLHRSTITSFLWIDFLNLSELILFSRADYESIRSSKHKNSKDASLVASWPALRLLANWRRVDTQWQVKAARPSKAQSKAEFLVSNISWFVFCYVILDVMMLAPVPDPRLHSPEKETIMHIWQLTAEEISFRVTTAISFWIMQYLWISKMFSATAVIAVMTGLTEPESWPPLNGTISCAFTVRKLWGQFWHQCLRQGLTGVSDGVCTDILRLKSPIIARYAKLLVAFTISGVIHQAINVAMGVHSDRMSAVKFFALQSVGIMIEDSVQHVTRSWNINTNVSKFLGYVWVLFFLCLTTPTWCYPQLRIEEDYSIIPFSVVKPLVASLGLSKDISS